MNGEADNLDSMNEQFDNMVEQGTGLLDKEGVPADRRYFEFAIDMRYQRQNFEISIPVPAGKMTEETLKKALADFHAEHKRSYGYCKGRRNRSVCKLPCFRDRRDRQTGS